MPDTTRPHLLWNSGHLSGEKRKLFERLLDEEGIRHGGSLPIPRTADQAESPLSFSQQRIWFLDQLEPGCHYNDRFALRLTGALDPDELERSLNEVIRRHEILRTAFPSRSGVPIPAVAPSLEARLHKIDLRHLAEADRESEAARLTREEVRRPFDLAHAPLLRAMLLRLAEEEHVFLLTIHQIVNDSWSLQILSRELGILYSAFSTGSSSPLSDVPLQYGDFARWQRQQIQGEVLDTQLAYWKRQLSGCPQLLQLPTDRPQPSVQTFRGGCHPLQLSKAIVAALELLGRSNGASLFMTVLAAFNLLLFRYTTQSDILVGVPISTRNRVEFERLVGMIINTLVIRTDLSGDPSFLELLRTVRQFTLEAYAHQELPFETLVEALRPARVLSHNPLFQVMFDYQSVPTFGFHAPSLTAQPFDVDSGTARCDLTLDLNPGPDGLGGFLEYNADLYEPQTIGRMAEHFHRLLESIIANPARRISELELLTPVERSRLLFEWNASEEEYPEDQCIHHLFEHHVARNPDTLAVTYEGEGLSYRELDRRASQLAEYLRGRGVGPDTVVAIYLDRGLEMMVALMGVLKAGAAYLPLDPSHPEARLAVILADAQPVVAVTQHSFMDALPIDRSRIICVDSDAETIAERSGTFSVAGVVPDDLAYLVYTSGSTGAPKGVQIPHRAAVNLLHSASRRMEITSHDVLLAVTTIAFDIAALELFLPLSVGGRLVVVSKETSADGAQLLAALVQSRATVMQATPATWRMLLHAGWSGSSELKILCGGEALTRPLAPQLRERGRVVWNLYGPTETTVWSACCRVASGDGPIAIGGPLGNSQLYVLDPSLHPVPVGVPGEICIGGLGLARGYLNCPDLTAEKFVPSPFSRAPGARLYRTGDLARYLPDGRLEFLGRLDNQVKIRGFRVELGEIETVLAQHHAVQETAVVLCRAEDSDARLVAHVVLEPDQTVSDAELRRFLARRLPEYMVPSFFTRLDRLPLTPSGKVDRRALPIPEPSRELDESYEAPRSVAEEVIAGIWRDLLGLERVGVHDNFFELGGHSLLATQLVFSLQQPFGVELTLRSLFEAPTVAGVAAEITERRGRLFEDKPLPAIVPQPANLHLPFPLTDVQQAYWVGRGDTFDLGNIGCHNYTELDVSGLDLDRFQWAVQRLVERHDMLRAVVLSDGRQQIMREVAPYRLAVLDLRSVPPHDAASRLDDIRQQMSHHVLPADRPFLFQIRASRLGDDVVRLHVSFDLLIADARSFRILFRELLELYRTPEISLPPLQLSFRDYVLAESAFQASEAYRRSERYWRERVDALPPAPALPLSVPVSSITKPRFARRTTHVEAKVWQRLKKRAARSGLTPAGLLIAAFSEVLATWSKDPRFTINLTLFNRLPLHREVNAIIGDFTSLTLLAVDASVQGTFETRARLLQQQLWETLDHRHFSGVKVLRELARVQREAPRALMPVVFTSTLGLDESWHDGAPLSAFGPIVYEITQTPQVWLDCIVGEQAGGLTINWDAVEELFPPGLLDDMLGAYGHLLRALADTEQSWQESSSLGLVPQVQLEERRKANSTELTVPDGLLHTAFLIQASRRPTQTAVIAPERSLSYQELADRSAVICRQLREWRVQRNTLVAVVMEKGWEQIVAVLAILRAGAAYLPIDATLPRERIWHLLDDGRVRHVLTQSWVEAALDWPPGLKRLSVDTADPGPVGFEREHAQSDDDLAYVIYTSGSTGLPKGVMIDHRAALNTIADINDRFRVGPDDRILALSSLSFDLSVYDIFGTLAAGGTIVMPSAADSKDPSHWSALMVRERVTIWNSVPALLEMWVDHAERGPEVVRPPLRLALLSGDWIPVTLPGRLGALVSNLEVVSLGGATEASIWSILYPIVDVDPAWKSIPYGRPLRNQRFHVLDHRLEPHPAWVPGELYIGGAGLAKGYWQDDEKTRAKFIVHPRTGERLYRTGDLGRYLPGGNIEFLGRDDLQVKIQGHRIELAEIEAALAAHPEVRAAVATAIGEPQAPKRLVAYVVAEPDDDLTADGLRRFLGDKLPAYMVPSAFVQLDALPLTANGKIDRQALPPPDLRHVQPWEDFVAPRTPAEQAVTDIWQVLLGIERIGAYDNFFELGGDSLIATRSVLLIRRAFAVDLPVRSLFDSPTPAALAVAIEELVGAKIEQAAVDRALP